MRSRFLLPLLGTAMLAAACSRSVQTPPPEPARQPARTTRPAAVALPAPPSAATQTAWADDVITRTNAERRTGGLPPLTRSINLMRAAQIQAAQMAKANLLEHEVPGGTHPTLSARLAAVQYPMRAAGENIGEGYRSPAQAVAGWMASSGHRANIMSKNYSDIGTAVAVSARGGVYWVQVFGRPK